MKFRDFKIGFRLLIQEPAYSAVVIFGLALGIAVCFLLAILVNYALSFNGHVPERERIYLVKSFNVHHGMAARWRRNSPLVIRDVIKNSGLPVTPTGAFTLSVQIDTPLVNQKEQLLLVDPSFANIFNVKAIAGDLPAALTQANSLALTSSMAEKLFGTSKVLGKSLNIDQQAFQVVAIVPDVPDNATEKYQILAGFNSSAWKDKERQNYLTNWGRTWGRNYLKLGANTTVESVKKVLQNSADHAPNNELTAEQQTQFGVKHALQIGMSSLSEVYFDADLNQQSSLANQSAIFGLLAVAVLILFLAANNYVNLASIRILRRQREIAMRKVLGATHTQIVAQFILESLLVAMLACALGLVLAWLALPVFSKLVGLELANTVSPSSYLLATAIGVVLGLLTAIYPCYLALKVNPASALAGRGQNEHHTGLWMRRGLSILQFSSALGFTSVCLSIAWQTHYVSTINPGYDTSHLLILDPPFGTSQEIKISLTEQLTRLPNVLGVSNAIDGFDLDLTTLDDFKIDGREPINLNFVRLTPNFFSVYRISASAGLLFDAKLDQLKGSPVAVLNAAAARSLGFNTPQDAVGQFMKSEDNTFQIIGIVPDIRHRTLREKPVGMVYLLGKNNLGLAIRVNSDSITTEQEIETIWKRHFPQNPLKLHSAASVFAEKYRNDLRLVQLLSAASVIASLIAAFGIYVLSASNVQRRAREIVLRKLYGANRAAISRLLGREFSILIALSALISLPLAWVYCQRYLAEFVERAPYVNWSLACALLLASLVALLATFRHTLAAMRMSPALALRD